MRVRVRFRVNADTGEVELFLVEDIGTGTELAPDHDETHDAIAYEVGKVVERRPAPEQVPPGLVADATALVYQPTPEEQAVTEGRKATE